ncbi:hypothetical protein ACWDSL_51730 [Streptomyces sp. NPDC000941]
MDPTLEGAFIGSGATALGSVIAWFGSRAQARAQLRAVTLQFRAQRFDGKGGESVAPPGERQGGVHV